MKELKFIDPSPMVVKFSSLGNGDPFVYNRRLFIKISDSGAQQVYADPMPPVQREKSTFSSNVEVGAVHSISVAIELTTKE